MPIFKIYYSFNGLGDVEIQAKNKEEAEKKFYGGDFKNEDEVGENYVIESIE